MAQVLTDGLGVASWAAPLPLPPPRACCSPGAAILFYRRPCRGGVAVVASMARAVVRRQGFAATAMVVLFLPPIPSSPTMALNINECGMVSSHLFYQLLLTPPPPHNPPRLSFFQICCPASKLASASASNHPSIAVISSLACLQLPCKYLFFIPALMAPVSTGGQVLPLQPQCFIVPPPLRVSVQLTPPLCLVAVVTKAGGVTEVTLMAPWRSNCDMSPFLRSG